MLARTTNLGRWGAFVLLPLLFWSGYAFVAMIGTREFIGTLWISDMLAVIPAAFAIALTYFAIGFLYLHRPIMRSLQKKGRLR